MQGAELVIFSEYCVQGIVSDAPHLIFEDGEVHTDISQLALDYKIDIAIGTLVERVEEAVADDNTGENKVYNTCVIH